VEGRLAPVSQAVEGATHAPVLTKDMGRIDWRRSARQVHDGCAGCSLAGASTHSARGG